MKLTGNTIFITGGGTGIGRGLAEALHRMGNQIIISGRRRSVLEETVAANPGLRSIEMNVESPESIEAVAKQLITDFPQLNFVINNAGMMKADHVEAEVDHDVITSTVNTNLLGPVLVTSAFIEHLKQQPEAAIAYVTSGLAYTPLAMTAMYSATKAAIHSFTLSQRYRLKDTNVKVIELAPPYVQTELYGPEQATDPRAMPLKDYIEETIRLLGEGAEEVLVERVKPLRNNVGSNEQTFFNQFNDSMIR